MDYTTLLRAAREDLGEMLWRLALRAAAAELTLKAIEEAVAAMKRRKRKVRGSAAVRRIAQHVRDTAQVLIDARAAKRRVRPAAPDLPWTSLEARLARRTTREAISLARALFRHDAAGGGSFDVSLRTDPGQICYRVDLEKVWNVYRGRFKRYPALVDRHVIHLGRDWLRRVCNAGLAVVDGALTLSVVPCATPEPGIELFRATRARQGRGYDVRTEHGFFGRDVQFDLVAWGPTALNVVRSVQRKRKQAAALISDAGLDEPWLSKHGQLRVTRADADAAGACRDGVEEWLRNAGLAHMSSAPLRQIHGAWLRNPDDYARRIMHLTARRARLESRPRGESPL